MTLEEIIKEKLSRLDEIPTIYSDGIKKTQKDIYSNLLDSLEMLSRDEAGNIKKTQRNLIIISDIIEDLKKIFTKSDYLTLTKTFISEFDRQVEITDDYFTKVFKDFEDSSFSKAALKEMKLQAYELMAGTPVITTNLYQPVESILVNAVSVGDSYTSTVKAIRQMVQGGTLQGKTLEGKLYRYSKQMAYDVFAVADRNYTNNLAIDLEVQFYQYTGGLVEDSRQFCITRNGKYYHRKEVESWGDLKAWDGKIQGTDKKTIFIYAGGYRCNHAILPVSEISVPKADIERAIEKGYYTPDEETKKLLGV